MKKSVLSFLIIMLVTIGASFRVDLKPDELIQAAYAKDIMAFSGAIDAYLDGVKAESGKSEPDGMYVLGLHKKCRLTYKKVEYLLAFFDEDAVKYFINGAPLPRVVQQGGGIKVLEPEGLQILDELVVEEGNLTEMRGKLERLKNTFDEIKAYEVKRRINDRQILEAMRLELVRVMSLGITGFDTPGTLNGIAESRAAMRSMYAHFQLYKNTYATTTKSFSATSKLFEESIDFLANKADFDSFDRLHFIREFINPLHEKLLDFHLEAGVEEFGRSR